MVFTNHRNVPWPYQDQVHLLERKLWTNNPILLIASQHKQSWEIALTKTWAVTKCTFYPTKSLTPEYSACFIGDNSTERPAFMDPSSIDVLFHQTFWSENLLWGWRYLESTNTKLQERFWPARVNLTDFYSKLYLMGGHESESYCLRASAWLKGHFGCEAGSTVWKVCYCTPSIS